MSHINQKTYNTILENMPILCVDGVIVNSNNEVLLLRRKNEPALNQWWFPGGRVLKNEKLESSILRKIKEETNLSVSVQKIIGITETIFDTGPFNIPVHTINITYLLKPTTNSIKIDKDHSDFIWTKKIDDLNLHPEIYQLLTNEYLLKSSE